MSYHREKLRQQKREAAFSRAIDEHNLGLIVAEIQDKNVDVNFETFSGETALTFSAAIGDAALIKFLINSGANPNVFTARGACALSEALACGRKGAFQLLLQCGADPLQQSPAQESLLNILISTTAKACPAEVEAEACESARTLLALGVDVNNCTEYGTTALDQAASRALPRLCQLLLDAGAHVEPDSTRETPLICALDAHCLETASLLLAAGATVDKETAGGLTALSMSCIEGNIEAVRFLLEQGADPNHVGANFSTPAILAAINNNAAALQLLVEAGADLQYENELNITPLVAACRNNSLDAIRVLIKAKVSPDTMSMCDLTPLMEATQFAKLEAMEVLLQEAHANPNIESKSTCSTALIQAIKIKNMGAIKTLMKGGANACQIVDDGDSPLVVAIVVGDDSILKELLRSNVTEYLRDNRTRLMKLALDMGISSVIKTLKEGLRDVDEFEAARALHRQRLIQVHGEMFEVIMEKIANGWGKGLGLGTAFLAGTLDKKIEECKFEQVLRIIKFARAEEEAQAAADGSDGDTASCESSDEEKGADETDGEPVVSSISRMWLKRIRKHNTKPIAQVPTEAGAEAGDAALQTKKKRRKKRKKKKASGRGGRSRSMLLAGLVLQLDLQKPAKVDINFESFSGYTALMRAAGRGEIDYMERFHELGADVEYENKAGMHTALTWASCQNQLEAVELLLTLGADINHTTRKGSTPLIEAVYWGNRKVVKQLVRKGAKVDLQTPPGRIALIESCNRVNVPVCKLLLQGGADANQENIFGYTPLMIACRRGSVPLVNLLKDYGADTKAVSRMRGTNALYEARSYGRKQVLGLMLKLNCLGKVDTAIREWEWGHVRRAFEKWALNCGVAQERQKRAKTKKRIRRLSVLVSTTQRLGQQYAATRARHAAVMYSSPLDHSYGLDEMQAQLVHSKPIPVLVEELGNETDSKRPLISLTFNATQVKAMCTRLFKAYMDLMSVYQKNRLEEKSGEAETKATDAHNSDSISLFSRESSTQPSAAVEQAAAEENQEDATHQQLLLQQAQQLSSLTPVVAGGKVVGFSDFVWQMLLDRLGRPHLALRLLRALVDNVLHFHTGTPQINLFGCFTGILEQDDYNGVGVFAAMGAWRYMILKEYVDEHAASLVADGGVGATAGASPVSPTHTDSPRRGDTRSVHDAEEQRQTHRALLLSYEAIEDTTQYILQSAVATPAGETFLRDMYITTASTGVSAIAFLKAIAELWSQIRAATDTIPAAAVIREKRRSVGAQAVAVANTIAGSM